MSKRTKAIVFLVGITLLCLGLVAIGYVIWPTNTSSVQGTLPPTFLAPP